MNFIENILKRIQFVLELFFWSEHYHSTAAEPKAAVRVGPALLKSAVVENNGSTDLYFHLYDRATEPAPGATPLLALNMPAKTTGSFVFNHKLATGIYVALSSTQFTYTATTANGAFNVEYKAMVN